MRYNPLKTIIVATLHPTLKKGAKSPSQAAKTLAKCTAPEPGGLATTTHLPRNPLGVGHAAPVAP